MLENGAPFGTVDVVDWYDCGRPETLLDANRVLLAKYGSVRGADTDTSVILLPVDFGEDVIVERRVVGPYVSVDDGGRIENSRTENAIIGENSERYDINPAETLTGASTPVTGTPTRMNAGDSSDVDL